MIRTQTRLIFNVGGSRTFTLPVDWPGRRADRVYTIYDDFLLIVPEELAEQIDLQQVQSILTKESGAHAPSREQ
jgi:hypothetical protein